MGIAASSSMSCGGRNMPAICTHDSERKWPTRCDMHPRNTLPLRTCQIRIRSGIARCCVWTAHEKNLKPRVIWSIRPACGWPHSGQFDMAHLGKTVRIGFFAISLTDLEPPTVWDGSGPSGREQARCTGSRGGRSTSAAQDSAIAAHCSPTARLKIGPLKHSSPRFGLTPGYDTTRLQR